MNYEREIMSGINKAIEDGTSEFESCLDEVDFFGRITKAFSSTLYKRVGEYEADDENGDAEVDIPFLERAFERSQEIFSQKLEDTIGYVLGAAIREFENRMSDIADEIEEEILKGE